MRYFRLWLVLSATSLGFCLVTFAVNVYRVLQSSDTGWIVRSGQYMITSGKLPEHDIFSWTCRQCHWVVYQWLFECVCGALFMSGGLWLVGLACCLLVALVFLYLLPRQWFSLGIPAFVTFACLALTLTPPCFFARPQAASYACIAIFAGILETVRTNGRLRSLWLLPPLMVIWANCHAFWFIGLIMIAAYLLDGWLTVLRRPAGRTDLRPQLILTFVLMAATASVLVNPYGSGLVTHAITFLQEPDFHRIRELRPLLEPPYTGTLLFCLYLIASWLLIFWRRRAVPAAGLCLVVASSTAALLMKRFAPVAAIIIWPFLGLALADLSIVWQRFPAPIDAQGVVLPPKLARICSMLTNSSGRLRRWPHLGLVVAIVLAMWLYNFPDPHKVWLTHGQDRRAATDFLRRVHLGPRIFNDATGGSNLILAGCLPVFIDTRFDLYGKEFCQRWQSCLDAEPGWQKYLREMDITHILVGKYSPLDRVLRKSEDWLCIYDDSKATIWLRTAKAAL